jgi:cobalt-zinc-cadmium efflux system protein
MHLHRHEGSVEKKGFRLWLAIILNVGITFAQVVGGIFAGSLALLSDALHNLSDVLALSISLFARKLVHKKSSSSKTFGFKRAEILAAFINAASLVVVSTYLIMEAIKRLIQSPDEIVDGNLVMIMAGVGIVGNALSVAILHKESGENMNMRSAYLHLISDMLFSVAVLAGGFVIVKFGIYWVDPALSIVIAVYLIFISWKLFYKSLTVLMQFAPGEIDLTQVAAVISKYPEIDNIHHIHAWELNEDEIHFEAHIQIKENITIDKVCELLQRIEEELQSEFGLTHITLQPEFNRDCGEELFVEEHHHHSS